MQVGERASSTPPELFRIVVRTGRPAVSAMQTPRAEKRGDGPEQTGSAADWGGLRHAIASLRCPRERLCVSSRKKILGKESFTSAGIPL